MKITEKVHQIYHQNLLKSEKGINYLATRGIDIDDIKRFELGMHSANVLTKNLSEEELKEAKRLSESIFFETIISNKNGDIYREYRDRIIYPLHKMDMFGEFKLIGFQSRAADERPLFKHRYLTTFYYNIFNEQAVKESDTVVITEGQNDAIVLCKSGFNAVGLMAVNSFRQENAEIFKQCGVKKVYIAFDNDENKSGFRGSLKTASILYDNGIDAYVCSIPMLAGKTKTDINEYYIHDRNKFKPMMLRSMMLAKKFRPSGKQTTKSVVRQKARFYNVRIDELWPFPTTLSSRVVTNCPFPDHKDDKKSFLYYTEKNDFYCWGCGRGGGPVEFFTYLNGFDSKDDAIRYLNERLDRYENSKYSK